MNIWQFSQQLKDLLATVKWPDASKELVFGADGVAVFAGTPTTDQIPPGFPWCLVGIGAGIPDEDQPELISQTFDLVTGVNVSGDPLGEHSITGGSIEELGESGGRGIAEITERVRNAAQALTGADGAQILLTATSIDTPTLIVDRHLTIDTHSMTALVTSALHYTAPQELAHGGTDWTWQGTHVSNRFDFLQYRLVRKSGTSASTSPSDGTVVFTGTATTFTGVATSGNTYTIFGDYNAREGTTVDGSSDPEVGSFRVIV